MPPSVTCRGLVGEMPSRKWVLWGWHLICEFVDCLVDEMAAFSADLVLMESHLPENQGKVLWAEEHTQARGLIAQNGRALAVKIVSYVFPPPLPAADMLS